MIVFSRPNVFNICLFEADFGTYRIGRLSSSRTEKKTSKFGSANSPNRGYPFLFLFAFSVSEVYIFIKILYLIFFFLVENSNLHKT